MSEFAAKMEAERLRIIAALESGHPTERDINKAQVLGIPLVLIGGKVIKPPYSFGADSEAP